MSLRRCDASRYDAALLYAFGVVTLRVVMLRCCVPAALWRCAVVSFALFSYAVVRFRRCLATLLCAFGVVMLRCCVLRVI